MKNDHQNRPRDLPVIYIVEGGAKTLQSFLVQNLWDEIRVETNLVLTVGGGTRAPHLPANAVVAHHDRYGDNQIVTYRKK